MRVQESYSEFPVRAIVVMGVSGSGKTSVGQELAHQLGSAPFIEGDTLHPPQNIAKMQNGTPLVDSDRWPWLKRLRAEIEQQSTLLLQGHDQSLLGARRIIGSSSSGHTQPPLYVICTCSALKRSYREFLSRADPENAAANKLTHDTVFLYLDVPRDELVRRLSARKNHFFDPSLLDSQLETLEVPDPTREAALVVHAEGDEAEVAADACRRVRGYVTTNSL
ncbi:hypothetical protein GGI07_005353 [Coemansia sp. Benny D115]|nr:hypothetical protein GGI07_005353 [Coemansia sp. Benny D115]